MNYLQRIVMATVALAMLASCEPKERVEGPTINSYSVNGTEHSFGSIVATMVGENIALFASPTAGLTDTESILTADEYIFVAIGPTLNGRRFNLVSESSLFTITSSLSGAELQGVSPGITEEIVSGELMLRLANGRMRCECQMTLRDGVTLSFNADVAAEGLVANENSLSRNDETKPVRAAFYRAEGGTTTLYLTPGGVTYFEELGIASWYMYLSIKDSYMTGEAFDVATLPDFTFGIEDNFDSYNSFCLTSADMSGVSGFVSVKRLGEGEYSVELNISPGNMSFMASFSGTCTSYDIEPEHRSNYIIYNNSEAGILSAAARAEGELWHITLNITDGSRLVATIPQSMCDGSAKGFSQSNEIAVTYDGRTYNKANGDLGTITVGLDQTAGTLHFSFMNYSSLEALYSGAVTIE